MGDNHVEGPAILVTAMAEKCRAQIQKFDQSDSTLPRALHPGHLAWMCLQIEKNAAHWPQVKLHRWLGFIQAGMLANRIVDLQAVKVMFDDLNVAFGKPSEDLVDHLDVASSFELDIGGQG